MTDENTGASGPLSIGGAGPGSMLMHIADRVIGRPLLIHPTKAEIVLHVLQGRIPIDAQTLAPLAPDASRFVGSALGADGKTRVYRMEKGVGMIPIIGSLVNRGAWIGASSGLTSYEGIAAQLRAAAADPDVKSILLDIDSPGGEATGMFTLARLVGEVAKSKRVVAMVNDMCASAAYGIASQSSEVVVSETSIVGSIGVVLTHLDRSGELAAKGIKPTLIYAGRHKVDGSPYSALTDAVKADLQAEVAKFYDAFVGLVAEGRGDRLSEVDARGTEARTFIGQDAVDRGLADRMAPLEAVLSSLQSESKPGARKNRPTAPMTRNASMTDETTAPQAGITKEAHEAALATARAEAKADGMKAGADAATARIGAILRSANAKGREQMAMTLALDTDMSAEAADKVLAVAPAGAAPSAADQAAANLAARSAAAGSFGAPGVPGNASASAETDGWASAVKNANQSIGVR